MKTLIKLTLILFLLLGCTKQDIPVCKTCHYEYIFVATAPDKHIISNERTVSIEMFTVCDDLYYSINNKVDTILFEKNVGGSGMQYIKTKITVCK